MTAEQFSMLTEAEKSLWLFEAEKLSETIDNDSRTQLFKIGEILVETKISLQGLFKRSMVVRSARDGAGYFSPLF